MEELGTLTMTILEDRGLKKVRINMVRGNVVRGFIRPIGSLGMRE